MFYKKYWVFFGGLKKFSYIYIVQVKNNSSLKYGDVLVFDCHENGSTTSREMILSLDIVSKK